MVSPFDVNNSNHLQRLREKRFGKLVGQHSNIFNLSHVELTEMEKEVLSHGLKFGVPPKVAREDVLAEFEVLQQQLNWHKPVSKEKENISKQN